MRTCSKERIRDTQFDASFEYLAGCTLRVEILPRVVDLSINNFDSRYLEAGDRSEEDITQ